MATPRGGKGGIWGVLVGLLELLRNGTLPLAALVAISLSFTFYIMLPAKPAAVQAPEPLPPPLFPQRDSVGDGPSWQTDPYEGSDHDGRRLRVVLGTLDENYRWLMGSARYVGISGGDSILVTDALATLRPDVELPVVVIGMASHENAEEHPEEEDARGQARADVMAQFASDHFHRSPEIYKVNLGAYTARDATSQTSAVERRVALMQITCRDPGVDLREALRDALVQAEQSGNTSVKGRLYSNFDLEQFRVIKASVGGEHSRAAPACSHRTAR